jgi:hypothetical protein
MRYPEHYCFKCGKWRELPYLKALCSECRIYNRPMEKRETR